MGAHSPEARCRALPHAAFSGHTCDPQDLVQEGHTGSCRRQKPSGGVMTAQRPAGLCPLIFQLDG